MQRTAVMSGTSAISISAPGTWDWTYAPLILSRTAARTLYPASESARTV